MEVGTTVEEGENRECGRREVQTLLPPPPPQVICDIRPTYYIGSVITKASCVLIKRKMVNVAFSHILRSYVTSVLHTARIRTYQKHAVC